MNFVIFPGQSRSAGIAVDPDGSAEPLAVHLDCCRTSSGGAAPSLTAELSLDPVPQIASLEQVSLPGAVATGVVADGNPFGTASCPRATILQTARGLTLSCDPPRQDLNLPVGNVVRVFWVTVAAPRTLPPGRYTASVSVFPIAAPSHRTTTTLFINVLAQPIDSQTPNCPIELDATSHRGGTGLGIIGTPGPLPLVRSEPLAHLVSQFLNDKNRNPAMTSWSIGWPVAERLGAAGKDNALTITVAKPTGVVPEGTARLTFTSDTDWSKEFVIFDGRTCQKRQTVTLMRGDRVSVDVDRATATTILLRRQVCADWFIWCWRKDWDNLVILSEASFWPLFGGREVTFDWFFSANE